MKIQDPGHGYLLDQLDTKPSSLTGENPRQSLIFVKREGENYPGNIGHYPGVTSQEVTRALIDRQKYTNNQQPCSENTMALYHYRMAIWYLENRARRIRGESQFPALIRDHIETIPTCSTCGHIECLVEHP